MIHLHGNQKRYVWAPTGRYISQKNPTRTINPTWVLRNATHTSGLWRHTHRPTQFTLVVDDFGVKYTTKEDAQHLINALKETYDISEDWNGEIHCGISLQWDYIQQHLTTS